MTLLERRKSMEVARWGPSRYPGVSHIVMDQLVKGPLSLAGAVPEVNPIAMALRKEQPKCRADSQRVGLSRVHRGVYCSSSRS